MESSCHHPSRELLIKDTSEITKEEFKDLFGLNKESWVDIAVVGKESNAQICNPDSLVKDVMRLPGVKFKDRDMAVEIEKQFLPL